MDKSIRPISIAIMALGGQGGGVLAEWVVQTAERAGYRTQYTSVAGVAQRTGATIYYIEMFPEQVIAARGREPVLSLMPVPGDVDIVIASELMEAGRAMMRGFVTPDRTTLIASTHRVYAISEKSAMADGRADGGRVEEAARAQAKAWIGFDLQRTAEEGGSVISAAMFGALAGSAALPFPRDLFEDVIRAGGRATAANLRTFGLAFDRASGVAPAVSPAASPAAASAPAAPLSAPPSPARQRIEAELPFAVRETATHGLARTVDFQDARYGALYIDRLAAMAAADEAAGGARHGHEMLREYARHLALWMSFEDTFRVADLKTRASRFERFRGEVGAAPDQIVDVTEFMHPRLEEIADSLPVRLGNRVATWRWLEPLVDKPRRIRTSSLGGFLLLTILAAARRIRRATRRFRRENAAIEQWIGRVAEAAAIDYALGTEIAKCQKLVRGYGETHERGSRNFEAIMAVYEADKRTPRLSARIGKLKDAALADDKGEALAKAIAA
ncbi:indolepyruvate oxidoreductase subunit beta family protein [Sphingopyxis panaciterrae]